MEQRSKGWAAGRVEVVWALFQSLQPTTHAWQAMMTVRQADVPHVCQT